MTAQVIRKRGRRPGYATVYTSEVLAAIPMWIEMGARPEDIADILGTTVGGLRARCSQVGISLAAVRPVISGGLPPPVWAALQRAADRRGYTVPRLVAEIIMGVAQRNLFSEVLDGDPAGSPSSGGGACAGRA